MSIIELKEVSYYYPLGEGRSLKALKNISLSIEQGEFIALVGMNGSGKSTLAKLLNGLFVPSYGKVLVGDLDTADDDTIYDIRKRVGIVFQNPDNQAVATIVEDDVAFGPENLGVKREELVKRVEESLDAVGMLDMKDRTFAKLSGGQKQRVAIAGVLAMQPDVIVLDESTSMLDPKGRKEIMRIVRKLHEEGKTIINITHHMDEAAFADRIIVLKKGNIISDGTPKEIFASKVIDEAGLKLPLTAEIAKKLNERGFNFKDMPLTKTELMEGICSQLK